jgi:CelD/BcsL family acetyltransferase involved in cellulose biosynthesis
LRRTLSKKRRDNLRRERRILANVGELPLHLQVITEPNEVPGYLVQADTVFADSWHAERGANKIRQSQATEDRLVWLAARGWLRCYVLTKGDEPIAFLQGLQCGRVFRALRTAYATEWAKFSPGKVMWSLVLEELYRSAAFDELDFGYGDWEYKRIMATDEYTVQTQEAIRPGLRNALVWSGPVAYEAVRRAVIALLGRFQFDARLARWSRKHLAR